MSQTKIIGGLDIGNGYVKGKLRGTDEKISILDLPSSVAVDNNPVDIPTPDSEVENVISDIFNEMDATFDSSIVARQVHRLFGKRGLRSGRTIEEFDVHSREAKSEQDLSGVLILGCIAGTALQDVYGQTKALPSDIISVTARIALALPISEYKTKRKQYVNMLKGTSHVVTIHNFKTPVRFEIKFEDVQVLAEGAAAQYAINSYDVKILDAMLADFRKRQIGVDVLEGVTGADLKEVKNTIGIDVGEGTTNFPVFQNGRFNNDASYSYNKGYGSVLDSAILTLNAQGFAFNSRKALSEYLLTKPTVVGKARYNKIKSVVDDEVVNFVIGVEKEFSGVVDRVGLTTEIVYLFGGGATAIHEQLIKSLNERSVKFGGTEAILPVLCLNSSFSRYLNRDGLYLIADTYAKQVG
jgi:plasmid segregation protein ParM